MLIRYEYFLITFLNRLLFSCFSRTFNQLYKNAFCKIYPCEKDVKVMIKHLLKQKNFKVKYRKTTGKT